VRARPGSIDVSELPTTAFGFRAVTTWGTLGFMLVEATTMAVGVAAYFYLRRNFQAYPPLGTPNPALLMPTLGLMVLLSSIAIARWTDRAAKRLDAGGVARSLLVSVLFGVIILVIRIYEGFGVHTRWDSDAYGSTVWMLLCFHTLLVLIDTIESTVMWRIMKRPDVEDKHFVDASDGAFYWYFAALVWIPLYVVLYLAPRWV
jgi:cytochrome c oxidase subunit 3